MIKIFLIHNKSMFRVIDFVTPDSTPKPSVTAPQATVTTTLSPETTTSNNASKYKQFFDFQSLSKIL